MSYSNKQSLKLAAKIDAKYGDKKLTKTANTQTLLGLLHGSSSGTAGILMDLANADQMIWDETIETSEGDEQAKAMAAAKKSYDAIMAAAKIVDAIEANFR